ADGASPPSAFWATFDLSTVTKENSAATKTPAATTRRIETPSRIQAVSTGPRPSGRRSRVRGDCQSRPWAGRGASDSEDGCRETLQTHTSPTCELGRPRDGRAGGRAGGDAGAGATAADRPRRAPARSRTPPDRDRRS